MQPKANAQQRIADVRRVFEEYGMGSPEMLEAWEGDDLSELAAHLTEEEFQTLLDELQVEDAG